MMNIEKYGVVELSYDEQKDITGGGPIGKLIGRGLALLEAGVNAIADGLAAAGENLSQLSPVSQFR